MEFHGLTNEIIEKAKLNKKCIVLPESNDLRILKAASELTKQRIADIVLIGKMDEIEFLCKANDLEIDLEQLTIIDPALSGKRDYYINALYELRKIKGLSMVEAIELMNDNVYFGTMMVKTGDADGLVCGAVHSTADTLRPALQIIKAGENTTSVSSCMLLDVPDCELNSKGRYVFADCGLIENPTEQQLVDIAKSSADTYRTLIGTEPKVAMLSYSTKGSAKGADVDRVVAAVTLLSEAKVDFEFDGELQVDSALIEEVAHLKAPNSSVAGHANVLVFPSLEAGNIGYKLVQRLAHSTAIGPITQGLAKPVNDLSRGCNIEEIIGAVAVTCVQAQKE